MPATVQLKEQCGGGLCQYSVICGFEGHNIIAPPKLTEIANAERNVVNTYSNPRVQHLPLPLTHWREHGKQNPINFTPFTLDHKIWG